jgi:hypothetical protein
VYDREIYYYYYYFVIDVVYNVAIDRESCSVQRTQMNVTRAVALPTTDASVRVAAASALAARRPARK